MRRHSQESRGQSRLQHPHKCRGRRAHGSNHAVMSQGHHAWTSLPTCQLVSPLAGAVANPDVMGFLKLYNMLLENAQVTGFKPQRCTLPDETWCRATQVWACHDVAWHGMAGSWHEFNTVTSYQRPRNSWRRDGWRMRCGCVPTGTTCHCWCTAFTVSPGWQLAA